MRKVCVIYNVFGDNERNNPYYLDAIKSLLRQDIINDGDNYKIAISSCNIHLHTHLMLTGEFHYLSHNTTHELLPVNVTFNDTVLKMRKHFGEFETYIYIDSGVNLWNLPTGISELYNSHKDKYAIVCADPSNDKGYEYWGAHLINEAYIDIPLGKAMNAHCNLYSKDILDAYDKILPDIFASDTSESVHWVMAAAVKKRMLLNKAVSVFHNHNMDGGSAFRGREFLFRTKKTIEDICRHGMSYGFGWEEVDPIRGLQHDESKFDANGYALDDRLKPFLKDNLFVSKEEFDYSTIKAEFKPGI